MTKTTRILAFLLCAAPLVTAADRPTPYQQGPGGFGRMPGEGFRPFRGDFGPQPSWKEVADWMAVHCPNRFHFLDRMGPQAQGMAKQLMMDRYRMLQRVRFKPIRDALTTEAEEQDQIFGATLDLRHAADTHDKAREASAQDALKEHVKKLFDAQIAEKQARIANLQQQIENQKKNESRMVEQWVKRMHNQATREEDRRQSEDAAPVEPDHQPQTEPDSQ